MTRQFEGKACSPGIGIGPVSVLPDLFAGGTEATVSDENIENELEKFFVALEQARKETETIRRHTDDRLYEQLSNLFSVQEMILDDPLFVNEVEKRIQDQGKAVEGAVVGALEQIHAAFSEKLSDEVTRGRMLDVVDVGWRVLRHLNTEYLAPGLPHAGILVARHISPSMAVRLEQTEIDGLITSDVHPSSHVSVVAQAMEIPTVTIDDDQFFQEIEPGDQVVVAANQDRVILSPTERQIEDYSRARDRFYRFAREKRDRAREIDDGELPCAIRGNIGLLSEISMLKKQGGHGAGLVRTELLFMGREPDYPDVDRQKAVYKQLARSVAPFTATFRTFDIGGDKEAFSGARRDKTQEGRGIHRSLQNRQPFRQQLRALLETYQHHDNLKLLIPMVGGPEEIRAVRGQIERLSDELGTGSPDLGVMVEIPSIVYMLDDVMGAVDYLTIGTNDLAHYLMGADRFEGGEVDSVDAPDPALFRCLEEIVEKASGSCPVGICGELAGNSVFTPVLLGMGVQELSMAPIRIPEVKLIAKKYEELPCEEYARKILDFEQRDHLKKWVHEELAPRVHELLE